MRLLAVRCRTFINAVNVLPFGFNPFAKYKERNLISNIHRRQDRLLVPAVPFVVAHTRLVVLFGQLQFTTVRFLRSASRF
jgi:hypothetical protein